MFIVTYYNSSYNLDPLALEVTWNSRSLINVNYVKYICFALSSYLPNDLQN
jgi:hypothetical protein